MVLYNKPLSIVLFSPLSFIRGTRWLKCLQCTLYYSLLQSNSQNGQCFTGRERYPNDPMQYHHASANEVMNQAPNAAMQDGAIYTSLPGSDCESQSYAKIGNDSTAIPAQHSPLIYELSQRSPFMDRFPADPRTTTFANSRSLYMPSDLPPPPSLPPPLPPQTAFAAAQGIRTQNYFPSPQFTPNYSFPGSAFVSTLSRPAAVMPTQFHTPSLSTTRRVNQSPLSGGRFHRKNLSNGGGGYPAGLFLPGLSTNQSC